MFSYKYKDIIQALSMPFNHFFGHLSVITHFFFTLSPIPGLSKRKLALSSAEGSNIYGIIAVAESGLRNITSSFEIPYSIFDIPSNHCGSAVPADAKREAAL
jgi:hypothetical protein